MTYKIKKIIKPGAYCWHLLPLNELKYSNLINIHNTSPNTIINSINKIKTELNNIIEKSYDIKN